MVNFNAPFPHPLSLKKMGKNSSFALKKWKKAGSYCI
jgi:hypothetical protein